MKKFRKTTAFILSVLVLAGLCSCGVKQYGIQRPPEVSVQDTSESRDVNDKIGFYTDQTKSMRGFCKKKEYYITLNEVRSVLKGDALKRLDIYRYDSIVYRIDENVFVQHYSDDILNTEIYYDKSKGGIASPKIIEKASAASKKGAVKPLEFALEDAFGKDKYTDSLCVFTTDGYEQNRDYSVLFKPLSEKVLKRGNAVALMGIRSDFNGKVYCVSADNSDKYDFKGKRMFFLIVTGPIDDVIPFCSNLSDRLNEKKIENYYSTFIPSGKTLSFVDNSVMLAPEDRDADELEDTKDGNSFCIDDMSEFLIKEEDIDYYPTFSVRLPKSGKAMSTFTIAAKVREGVAAPPLRIETEILSYNGIRDKEDSGKDDMSEDAPAVSDKPLDNTLKINTQPTNLVFKLGDSVTLSLEAQGDGLTYQWYYKKADNDSFTLWNGRIHAAETCTPNETWDGIQLYCIVTDSTGNTVKSDTITVKVNDGAGGNVVSSEAVSVDNEHGNIAHEPQKGDKPDEFAVSNLKVDDAPYLVQESINVNSKATIGKDSKLKVQTVVNDSSLVKDSGVILVKYSVFIGQLEDTPKWILDNSASSVSTKDDEAKTLDLVNVYDGLKQVTNATMDNSELFTFYCYYY